MKKIITAIFLLLLPAAVAIAQNSVYFELIRGIEDGPVKSKIESETTKLLTMLNERQSKNKKALSFEGISISDEAQQTILLLWEHQHMRVWEDVEGEEPYISETCLRFGKNGYQVRNIPMRIFPVDGSTQDDYTEVCINYDLRGNIIDFNITMAKQQYSAIIKNAVNVEDEHNRMIIAHWMEQFRTAYNQKNLQFLENVFSDDVIIITGVRKYKVVKEGVPSSNSPEFVYTGSTKTEYLNKLKGVFKKNDYINVTYGNDATYRQHGGNPRYYIVEVTQNWNSSTYSDVGRLFVLWDFIDPDNPKILVRSWQHIDDEKHFNFKDFSLPR